MKHSIYITTFLMVLGLPFSACKKQLNVFPTSFEADGNLITDQRSAKTALNGIYYCLANTGPDYNNIPTTLWHSVNEMIPSALSGLFLDIGGNTDLSDHIYQPSTYDIGKAWDYGYKIVNAANGFIKNMESASTIPADIRIKMIAEAKFLRAYANSNLLFYYGEYDDINSEYGIVLRNEFVTAGNINLPRASVKETYDAIIADLDEAITHLPELNTDIWYANAWCARLLKARVLMGRGEEQDFANIITITNDIIDYSPFALQEQVKDVFLSEGLSSQEVMLGIQPYNGQIMKNETYAYYHAVIASDLAVGLFENDPRNEWVFRMAPDNFLGELLAFTKYYPGSTSEFTSTSISEYGYVFRLTEAYLLKAEAIVASGGNLDDAKDLLKTVMQHAGFTVFTEVDTVTTHEELHVLLIKEVMKNFAGEAGQDWFAVRRLPLEELQTLLPSVTNKNQLVLPIPLNEIIRNNNMKQNPGYN